MNFHAHYIRLIQSPENNSSGRICVSDKLGLSPYTKCTHQLVYIIFSLLLLHHILGNMALHGDAKTHIT